MIKAKKKYYKSNFISEQKDVVFIGLYQGQSVYYKEGNIFVI
jgi:hypothetical protein